MKLKQKKDANKSVIKAAKKAYKKPSFWIILALSLVLAVENTFLLANILSSNIVPSTISPNSPSSYYLSFDNEVASYRVDPDRELYKNLQNHSFEDYYRLQVFFTFYNNSSKDVFPGCAVTVKAYQNGEALEQDNYHWNEEKPSGFLYSDGSNSPEIAPNASFSGCVSFKLLNTSDNVEIKAYAPTYEYASGKKLNYNDQPSDFVLIAETTYEFQE